MILDFGQESQFQLQGHFSVNKPTKENNVLPKDAIPKIIMSKNTVSEINMVV